MPDTSKAKAIVYDGECPFCSQYVKMLHLQKTIGKVELIDARSSHPLVTELTEKNIDLDEGMAFIDGEDLYYGDECINKLALLSTSSNLFNTFNYCIFRSKTLSKILYPMLKFGRNSTLKLLGRKKIRHP